MRILLIGGSRFVGPLLIEKLSKRGHSLTIFNRGNLQTVYPPGVIFIKGDRNLGFGLKDHFDIVIDMCSYQARHTEGALKELNFDFFIHFGTAAAYQKTEIFPLTEESPLGNWLLWGDYNKGKVECEEVLKKSDIKFATIRPVYILGPKNYLARESFIYSKIKKGLPIILPGNGQAITQFVHVEDVAKTFAVIAEKKLEGAFNCAGDESITLKGLVEGMAKIAGKEALIRFNPNADGDKFNDTEFPFANENFFCSNEKIKKLGTEFKPLVIGLKEDYEKYYQKVI